MFGLTQSSAFGHVIAQKMKCSIKDFLIKYDQIKSAVFCGFGHIYGRNP